MCVRVASSRWDNIKAYMYICTNPLQEQNSSLGKGIGECVYIIWIAVWRIGTTLVITGLSNYNIIIWKLTRCKVGTSMEEGREKLFCWKWFHLEGKKKLLYQTFFQNVLKREHVQCRCIDAYVHKNQCCTLNQMKNWNDWNGVLYKCMHVLACVTAVYNLQDLRTRQNANSTKTGYLSKYGWLNRPQGCKQCRSM